LINSNKEEVFVEVNLDSIKNKIDLAIDDNFSKDIISKNDLRPSIETSFHALIDFKYVLHVHSTSTIANAISLNSEIRLKEIIKEDFNYIPYARPGFPLTMMIKKKFNSKNQIFILENHGLIVAGNELQQTHDLLLDVHQKLDIIRNNHFDATIQNSESLIENYSLKNDKKYNLFKTVDKKIFSAFSKSFYPDHVIFLGPGIPTFEYVDDVNNFLSNLKSKNINPPPYFILKEIGLYEISSVIPAAREMMDCFLEVLLRINFQDELKNLSQPQENELLNWDAEIYRQSIS
jgi:rhamnose utilization protein RhaD (predicted bifunctional aldolase and dehydrogenase)